MMKKLEKIVRDNLKPLEKKLQELLKNKFFIIALFVLSFILILLPFFFKVQFEHFKALGIFGIFLISFIGSATILLPTPAILAVGFGATIYNPLVLAIVATFGSTLGETTTFIFGFTSKKLVDIEVESKSKFKNKALKFFDHSINEYGNYLIPFLAFIPNPFFDGLGLIAGIVNYPIKKYLALTFIGRFARFLLIGLIGQSF